MSKAGVTWAIVVLSKGSIVIKLRMTMDTEARVHGP